MNHFILLTTLKDKTVLIPLHTIVGVIEETHDGKHVATEVFTTNAYVHWRVKEKIAEIMELWPK